MASFSSASVRFSRVRLSLGFAAAGFGVAGAGAWAQQPVAKPIASVSTAGVSLTGSLSVANGRAQMANNSSITAGDKTAEVALTRGGALRVCASTEVHLSQDATPRPAGDAAAPASEGGLMVALDRGALEARYKAGTYSDVLMTPDLRILISGPGDADLALRVNRAGDTCVDNRGDHAPYVTVTSMIDGGLYRVQPNQRVMFEHGNLNQVVDREAEPCGCPAPEPQVEVAGKPKPGEAAQPSADTAFPLAVSEGLEAPPASPTTPVVPAGQPHAQVTAVLSNDTPPGPPPASEQPQAGGQKTAVPPVAGVPPGSPSGQKPQQGTGFLHSFGHFFSHLFGG